MCCQNIESLFVSLLFRSAFDKVPKHALECFVAELVSALLEWLNILGAECSVLPMFICTYIQIYKNTSVCIYVRSQAIRQDYIKHNKEKAEEEKEQQQLEIQIKFYGKCRLTRVRILF